jgi:hypothetical protein
MFVVHIIYFFFKFRLRIIFILCKFNFFQFISYYIELIDNINFRFVLIIIFDNFIILIIYGLNLIKNSASFFINLNETFRQIIHSIPHISLDLKDIGHGLTTGSYVQHLVENLSLNNTMTSFYRPTTADSVREPTSNARDSEFCASTNLDDILEKLARIESATVAHNEEVIKRISQLETAISQCGSTVVALDQEKMSNSNKMDTLQKSVDNIFEYMQVNSAPNCKP